VGRAAGNDLGFASVRQFGERTSDSGSIDRERRPIGHSAGVYDCHGYIINSRIIDIKESDGLEIAFGFCRNYQHWHYDNGLFFQLGSALIEQPV